EPVLVADRLPGTEADAEKVNLDVVVIGLQLEPSDVCFAQIANRNRHATDPDAADQDWRRRPIDDRLRLEARQSAQRAEPQCAVPIAERDVRVVLRQAVRRRVVADVPRDRIETIDAASRADVDAVPAIFRDRTGAGAAQSFIGTVPDDVRAL